MNKISSMQTIMEVLAKNFKPAEGYWDEVDQDIQSLYRFDGHTLIWLLMAQKCVLVPTQVGANPLCITGWIWSKGKQPMAAYSLNTRNGSVEKISIEDAEKLIMLPPCNLSILQGPEKITKRVDDVLKKGCAMLIWRCSDAPSPAQTFAGWKAWMNYFHLTQNALMRDFMEKAIRMRRAGLDESSREGWPLKLVSNQ